MTRWHDPTVRVTSAAFTAEHEVELTLGNGTTARVPFDPGTLQPAQTLDSECQYTGGHVKKV
ncbi:hypothetical protein [Dactylosporangium sp. NPDC005555]|uniref:hypothetical protein n=1 Tax=Dactylosporangium sp. NPDC005555 TaxID=3154889 RepID=UPI0033A64C09